MKTISRLEKLLEEIRKKISKAEEVNIRVVPYLSPLNKIMLRKNSSGKWKLPGGPIMIELDSFLEMEFEMMVDSLKRELRKDTGLSLDKLPEATCMIVDVSDPTSALFSIMILVNLSNYCNTEARFAEFVEKNELKFFSQQEIIRTEEYPDEFVKRAFRTILPGRQRPGFF